jgi:hypothetical protein
VHRLYESQQVFDRLRLTRTKLNPDKCVFGVTAGKLLGFLVSCRGIEANPEKIKTIEAMQPPARIKEVQKLTGCLAAQDPEAQVGPDTWITEIRTYLKDNILPDDMASADRIAHLAKRYALVEGDLY